MADWMETLRQTVLQRLQGRAYYGASGGAQMLTDATSAMRAGITAPVAGGAPQRTNYLTLVPGQTGRGGPAGQDFYSMEMYGGRQAPNQTTLPTYNFNQQQYLQDRFAWMRNQAQYRDWSDQEIRGFLADTAGLSDSEVAARELWTSSRISTQRAQDEATAERNEMLGELNAFKAGFNEEWIGSNLAREAATWDAKINQTMQNIQAQYAQMGRVASPFLLGEVARRMAAQRAEALQVRRLDLERERDQRTQWYLEAKNAVLSNTVRQTPDVSTMAALVSQLGAAAAA